MKDLNQEIERLEKIHELLQIDYEHEFNRKNILEEKASKLTAFLGVILTFQGSLGLSLNLPEFLHYFSISYVLLFSFPLIFYSISLFFFIKAFLPVTWYFMPNHNDLMTDYEKENNLETILNDSIQDYNSALESNKEVLSEKDILINMGISCFYIGLIFTLIYLIISALLVF